MVKSYKLDMDTRDIIPDGWTGQIIGVVADTIGAFTDVEHLGTTVYEGQNKIVTKFKIHSDVKRIIETGQRQFGIKAGEPTIQVAASTIALAIIIALIVIAIAVVAWKLTEITSPVFWYIIGGAVLIGATASLVGAIRKK